MGNKSKFVHEIEIEFKEIMCNTFCNGLKNEDCAFCAVGKSFKRPMYELFKFKGKEATQMLIHDIPEYAKECRYIVMRRVDGELCFWGAYKDRDLANHAAQTVGGFVIENERAKK